jgi:hypothetical protein
MVGARLVMDSAIDARAYASRCISDTYGQAMTAYRASVYQLVDYIDSLVDALSKTG